MGLFGSSSSKSSSSSSSLAQDNRVVSDSEAQAISNSNGSGQARDQAQLLNVSFNGQNSGQGSKNYITFSPTDYGAIQGALTFADEANSSATQTVKDVLGISKQTFDETTAALKDAYTDAKGGALVLQNVTLGMMLTIGAIAYFWLGKGKK